MGATTRLVHVSFTDGTVVFTWLMCVRLRMSLVATPDASSLLYHHGSALTDFKESEAFLRSFDHELRESLNIDIVIIVFMDDQWIISSTITKHVK